MALCIWMLRHGSIDSLDLFPPAGAIGSIAGAGISCGTGLKTMARSIEIDFEGRT
jgi:hypothetical protein